MGLLESIPAVRRIETSRADLSAFEIDGHVSAADAENLYGLLEAAYALHDRIDVLVRLIDHDGIDWNEIDPDTLARGKELARAHVRRCAAVGGPDWTGAVRGWFEPAVEVELRHFTADAEGEAWAWLGARPTDTA